MTLVAHKISPCLWFDGQAEEAARFYVSVFKNSKLGTVSRYSKAGKEIHGGEAGSVMTVSFEINGVNFVALNGGPHFKFNEAVSFQVYCESQADIDYYWSRLGEGGQEGPCGWIKDKFGLSWQVVPVALTAMLTDRDSTKVERATNAFLKMKKFDLEALKRAFDGRAAA
jgi:predicted 3-demethylubiquinone-9 3-methyltransferase (glyoxalase superfamily)